MMFANGLNWFFPSEKRVVAVIIFVPAAAATEAAYFTLHLQSANPQ